MSMESSALPASKPEQVKTHQDSHRARVIFSKPSSSWLTQSPSTYSGAAQPESPEDPSTQTAGPTHSFSSVGLEWSLRLCISTDNKVIRCWSRDHRKENHCIPNSQGLEQGTESALFINVHLPCTYLLNK